MAAVCVCVAAFVPEALRFPATMGCVGRDSVKRCERFTRPHGECVHTFVFVYLPRTFFRVCTCGNFAVLFAGCERCHFWRFFLWGLNVASGELVVVDYRGFFNGDWRSIESLVHSFEKDWCTYYLKVERFVVVSGCNWILGVWNNFMEISFRTNNKLIERFFKY